MICVKIPGFKILSLSHLVMDYNGTLAVDGCLLPGVRKALQGLAKDLKIHVITADTFGLAASQLKGLPLTLKITPPSSQEKAKLQYIKSLGAQTVAAIGNGRNDRLMLKAAALGVALIQEEGASVAALQSAHIAAHSILDALDLLKKTKRLIATLRS